MNKNNKYDIIVIGGGHAGTEAAYVSSNMGAKVALLTMDFYNIGKPSCNPSIGGTSKGHIVKEIDALGGAMGLLADRAGIQFKMLNKSKGPAIWSPRSQIDYRLYPLYALDLIFKQKNISLIKAECSELLVKNSNIEGIKTIDNEILYAPCVIICSGTFLKGKMFTGEDVSIGGRYGEKSSELLSEQIASFGLEKGRLKTGTPPRIDFNSIDFAKVDIAPGDAVPKPFSSRTSQVANRILCYSTQTTVETHDLLRTGFSRSPMFTGRIEGVGPRYCPSIEDKIHRFSDKNSHKILLEPEGLHSNSVYVNGFSTSLPADVQLKGLRSIKGLENCRILRNGYAIEYDYFFPYQLKYTLETKEIAGLFFAGQINGTSGYEEAAAQGLIAGINAVLKIRSEKEFKLQRSEAYIGVLIDDLINKNSEEPYRMFSSLAEYRLLLRQDNAQERLIENAFKYRLVSRETYDKVIKNKSSVEFGLSKIKTIKLKPQQVNHYLSEVGENLITDSTSIFLLAKRTNTSLDKLLLLSNDLTDNLKYLIRNERLINQLTIEVKYDGYIQRQKKEVEYFIENEKKYIPKFFDYNKLTSLSNEAREKLNKIRPSSLGQASRIAGVSATDVSIISVYLK